MNKKELTGSWTLVGVRMTDREGNDKNPYSDATTGLLIYTADGYMSAAMHFVDHEGGKQPFFYAGSFEAQEGQTIHHVTYASDPGIIGTKQVRLTRFDGDRLVLTAAESLVAGPGIRAEAIWERAG